MITWRDLKNKIDEMSDDELDDMLVRIYDENGEACGVEDIGEYGLYIDDVLEKSTNPIDWWIPYFIKRG